MAVYFIRESSSGHVKIGHAEDPWARLGKIQVDCPGVCRLLAVLPGGVDEERAEHARYDESRLRGEWFRFEGALADFLAAAAKPERPKIYKTEKAEQIARLRAATGEKFQTVDAWIERGAFPAWHFKAIAAAGIYTLEEMADLAAMRFAEKRAA